MGKGGAIVGLLVVLIGISVIAYGYSLVNMGLIISGGMLYGFGIFGIIVGAMIIIFPVLFSVRRRKYAAS